MKIENDDTTNVKNLSINLKIKKNVRLSKKEKEQMKQLRKLKKNNS